MNVKKKGIINNYDKYYVYPVSKVIKIILVSKKFNVYQKNCTSLSFLCKKIIEMFSFYNDEI